MEGVEHRAERQKSFEEPLRDDNARVRSNLPRQHEKKELEGRERESGSLATKKQRDRNGGGQQGYGSFGNMNADCKYP